MTHLRPQPPGSAVQACVGLLMCEVQHCMHSIGQGHHTIKVAESSARHSKWTRWGSNRFSTVLRVKVANLQTEICMRSRGEIASNPWSTQSAQTPHRIKTGMRQEPINRPHRLVVRTSRCGRDNQVRLLVWSFFLCAPSASIDHARETADTTLTHDCNMFNQ